MVAEGTKTFVSLDVFEKRKAQIASALVVIGDSARSLNANQQAGTIDQALRSLAEERFRLVVVGEFSNGKSTLINALLGERVLPSSVQPTTAVLSVIRGGDTPAFRVHYRDAGTPRELSQEGLLALVAPPEPDRASERQVAECERATAELQKLAYVEIRYPTDLLAHGVELVDTPGTNDLDPVREQITYEFIPQADAVVIVLSAKRILAQSEVDFIRDRILKADIQRLFFAINFADFLKSDGDRQKIIAYARDNLRPIVGTPRLHLVCAKDALFHRRGLSAGGSKQPLPFAQTGFREFEEAIAAFLNGDRGAVKLERPIATGLRIASELMEGPLAIRKGALGLSVLEIKSKIGALRPKMLEAERQKNEVLDGLKSRFANEGSLISGELRRGLENVAIAGVAAVDGHQGELTGEAILQSVERAIAPLQSRLVEHVKSRQETALADECARAQRRIEAAWGELQTSVDHIFSHSTGLAISVDLARAVGKDDEKLVFGGGIFATVLVAALHVVFPIALAVGVLTAIGLGSRIEQKRREQILGQARAQVDERLRSGIQGAANRFDIEWVNLSKQIVDAFDAAFNARLDSLRSEMEFLVRGHETETQNAAIQGKECDALTIRLEQAVRTLKAII